MSGDGHVLAVVAHLNSEVENRSGHVRIFEFDDTNNEWVQRGSDIDGKGFGDQFGGSVDLSDDGNIVTVSSRFHKKQTGEVQVYTYQGSMWELLGTDLVHR